MENKNILLCVTGSIAAYKAANLASLLVKKGANVYVILTKNATNFINPITFESITKNPCIVDTFDKSLFGSINHIDIAKKVDLVVIAPASANTIAKLAFGLADDALTTTVLACKCPKLIVPAMNTNMYENPATVENMQKLSSFGFMFIDPICDLLACGDIGVGKMAEPFDIAEEIEFLLFDKKDLKGVNVLVTAGATKEYLDPVRYISNDSSGKMGYAIAKNAVYRGANVTLISGETSISPIKRVDLINIISAKDMFKIVKNLYKQNDVLIFSAAVCDYSPDELSTRKLKKTVDDLSKIKLKENEDILKYVGQRKAHNNIVCGFSMETEDLYQNSKKKLVDKNADIIVANLLNQEGAGFKHETNIVEIITYDRHIKLGKMSKYNVAEHILDEIIKIKIKG